MKGEKNLLQIAIIPAYEPPSTFYEYAKKLTQTVDRLIVVNDGSGPDYNTIFAEIGELPQTTVLSYGENHGKGYALKTAFSYCGSHFDPDDVLVTADCDGQHAISDVLAVCDATAKAPQRLHFGFQRIFSGQCTCQKQSRKHPNAPVASVAIRHRYFRQSNRTASFHSSYSAGLSESQR